MRGQERILIITVILVALMAQLGQMAIQEMPRYTMAEMAKMVITNSSLSTSLEVLSSIARCINLSCKISYTLFLRKMMCWSLEKRAM